jgi:hypothetical protein
VAVLACAYDRRPVSAIAPGRPDHGALDEGSRCSRGARRPSPARPAVWQTDSRGASVARADGPLGSLSVMRDETIGSFLARLAARSAAPGGGATGALHAAQAAALLAMVARFSDGPRYDAETVGRVRAAADGLADEAVDLAVADEAAFARVAAAYQLPRQTPEETQARSAAIEAAVAGAAGPRPT